MTERPARALAGASVAAATASLHTMSLQEKKDYLAAYKVPFTNDYDMYDKIRKIGQGTFGYVVFFLSLDFFLFCYLHILKNCFLYVMGVYTGKCGKLEIK